MNQLLNTVSHGNPDGQPPLLILHGLFGAARNWRGLQKRLAMTRQVVAVDLRNHGESFHANSHSYQDLANDVARVVENLGGSADVLGHSMGGKAAMVLALTRPELVNRLIVADIAPVSYGHTQQGLIDAMRSVNLVQINSRQVADAQLQKNITDAGIRAFLLQSLSRSETGWRWQFNLDGLAAAMKDIIGFPELATQFSGATLFLSGAGSDYVQPDFHSGIETLFPAVSYHQIPDAGHWLHAEKPTEFLEQVTAFLAA